MAAKSMQQWENNKPFPSRLLSDCENESSCENSLQKSVRPARSFSHANQTHFHTKSSARGLVLNQRQKAWGNPEMTNWYVDMKQELPYTVMEK